MENQTRLSGFWSPCRHLLWRSRASAAPFPDDRAREQKRSYFKQKETERTKVCGLEKKAQKIEFRFLCYLLFKNLLSVSAQARRWRA